MLLQVSIVLNPSKKACDGCEGCHDTVTNVGNFSGIPNVWPITCKFSSDGNIVIPGSMLYDC